MRRPAYPITTIPAARPALARVWSSTIEPSICAGSGEAAVGRDRWTVRTTDGSLALYEHTLVITLSGPILLTAT